MVFAGDLIVIFNNLTCHKSGVPHSMRRAPYVRLNFEAIWAFVPQCA